MDTDISSASSLPSGEIPSGPFLTNEDKMRVASILCEQKLANPKDTFILTEGNKKLLNNPSFNTLLIKEILDRFPKTIEDKLNRSLLNLSKLTKSFGDEIDLDYGSCPIFYAIQSNEASAIIRELKKRDFVDTPNWREVTLGTIPPSITLTAEGYKHITALGKANDDSKQASISMGGIPKDHSASASSSKKKIRRFETLADTYTEDGQIGEGGAGTVLRVISGNGNPYALKYLSPDKVTEIKVKRFRNELAFCSKNICPNIIRIIDEGFIRLEDIKCPFYVMPIYQKTLRNLITEGIQADEVLTIYSQILNGVKTAHSKVVWHRDLKPENILYDPVNKQIVIADFGIAHFEEEQLLTTVLTGPHDRLCNLQYAAPEQRRKGSNVNHKADIFALGLILNEMFTRVVPEGSSFKKISDFFPAYSYLDEIVDEMIRQTPEERLDSIDIVIKKIEGAGKIKVSSILPKANAIPAPHDSNLAGEVTFNYSSHDGRYSIGNGNFLFETKWSKASNRNIHCYNDMASISGVAIIPKGSESDLLQDVSKCDFTSRSRSPGIGQFVVYQNVPGFFALLRIESIKDSSRGDIADELRFRYWIRNDGRSDFSKIISG